MRWDWLGVAAYRRVLADQLALRERVWAGDDGAVLLCEHPPVITLGRSANRDNVLDAGDVPVETIERGGDVTYHGPGQLMIYPIIKLRRGVIDFLERVSSAITEVCELFGVPDARWQRDPAGVWLAGAKLAACGIHIARGVSVHGFAMNVATPDDAWKRINPCGLDAPLISLSRARAERGIPDPELTVSIVAAELGPRIVRALG